jgi:dethiobiotin synthetase
MKPIFITGIGTGVGKTITSAIVTEALHSDYWKPVQAGFEDGTDALNVQHLVTNKKTIIHPEVYKLALAASPHIAAREENLRIELDEIVDAYKKISSNNDYLVIEGAGGLLVPLNEDEFVLNLIERLEAEVILVSRNYMGSINHSLLTAAMCQQRNINVVGWIFNDHYLDYEKEIAKWSGYPLLGTIPLLASVNKGQVLEQARRLREVLKIHLYS